jgi:sterol desaturase/sphingolipid hydroxylase (fatty acid hydroxylase superfamily)
LSKEKKMSSNHSGGIGFCGMLTIVFVVLKLTNIISWSWWWIFAPLWIPFILIFLLAMLLLSLGYDFKD